MPVSISLPTIKSVRKFFSYDTVVASLVATIIVVFVYKHGVRYNQRIAEGFDDQSDRSDGSDGSAGGPVDVRTTVTDIYDTDYADIYDALCDDPGKHKFEVEHIIGKTNVTADSSILDVGSGTGHIVETLAKERGCAVIGIDKSAAMHKKASTLYPSRDFRNEDALTSIAFEDESFTHITCLYFTLYYIKDKHTLFKNCYDWLKPGGSMVVHLVNKHMFDPVLPPGNPLQSVNAQKYAKERIVQTNIVFNKYNYTSEFLLDDVNDGKTQFVETFSTKRGNNVFKKNVHTFHMGDRSDILTLAKQMGFIVKAKYDMSPCSYEYNFLYVLTKPH